MHPYHNYCTYSRLKNSTIGCFFSTIGVSKYRISTSRLRETIERSNNHKHEEGWADYQKELYVQYKSTWLAYVSTLNKIKMMLLIVCSCNNLLIYSIVCTLRLHFLYYTVWLDYTVLCKMQEPEICYTQYTGKQPGDDIGLMSNCSDNPWIFCQNNKLTAFHFWGGGEDWV